MILYAAAAAIGFSVGSALGIMAGFEYGEMSMARKVKQDI